MNPLTPLPRIAPLYDGSPGRIRERPEDFIVEEIPLYEPTGEGEHVWVVVEKRGLTTPYLARQLTRHTGVPPRDIGFAGRKDRHAVTTQILTLRGADPERVERLDIEGVRILLVTRHRRKIRRGHLRANRFRITIRGVHAALANHAEAAGLLLRSRGLPNYFGPQRFGRAGANARIGKALLLGEAEEAIRLLLEGAASTGSERPLRHALERGTLPERAIRRIPRDQRRLYLESLQSDLFNRCLARRLPEFDRLWQGDLAQKHENGAVFLVEEPETEQGRADRFEISPTGPLYGFKMTSPDGAEADLEGAVLAELADPELLARSWRPARLPGARRAYRIPIEQLSLEHDLSEQSLRVDFSLPPGSYATTVLRELLGNDRFEAEVPSSPCRGD